MIEKNIQKALKIVSDILNNNHINWMLIGSCNLAIHGLDVVVRDVDICVDKKEFKKINKLFSKFGEIVMEQFPSSFGGDAYKMTFSIEGIDIELLGEGTQNIYSEALAKGDFNKLEIFGTKIYVNKLENEYESCIRMNKFEKATKIKEYLNNL